MAMFIESHRDVVLPQPALRPPAYGGLVERLLATLRLWNSRRIERAALARFGRTEMADLGLNEADILAEINKPVWRA